MEKEEAIREIKRFMSILPNDMQEAIMALVPELAESVDERIRKELKEAFEAYDIESTWNGIPIRSIFAWLEKQKEPGYKHEDYFCEKCQANAFYAGRESVLKDQKPWSEEDEDAINGAIGIILDDNNPSFVFPEHSKLSVGEIVKRLKSLRPQPKPEWSEEDKRKLNRIYEILGQAADERPFGSSKRIIGDKEAVELQDFIRFLRPSGKPSEEQKEAL